MLAASLALLLASASVGLEQSETTGEVACLRVLAPLGEDDVPVPDHFEAAPCRGAIVAHAFRYDRSERATRVARSLGPGDIVRRYPEYASGNVVPGQMLRLVVADDVVRVERQVEALQEARPGQRLFVRSRDGQILSVRYEPGAP